MSEFWVTPTGFIKKTLDELKTEYELLFQGVFGDDIDLDADGAFGQIIGLLAKRDADLWDGAEEIYDARNPLKATGVSLDNIVAENALERIDATATQVSDVILYGDQGTVVLAGKKAKADTNEVEYSLLADVTIDQATARHGEISVDNVTTGFDYTVTIESINYTYTAIGGDTEIDILDELKILIDAGSWTGNTVVNTTDELLEISLVGNDFSFSVNSNLIVEQVGSAGSFNADITGANTLPANTLTIIVTPVTGWDLVNNPSAGITGNDEETDVELRIRREKSILSGNATDEAIRSALLDNVEGVTGANVISNRTDVTDSESRPPHSFEAIVQGGTDADVAMEIWTRMPSGIQTYGNTSEVIQDSQGMNQTINFSRAEPVYIHVQVKRNLYAEESYPADGDDLIKDSIVAWSLETSNIDIGIDVIRQRLSIPIYEVPGIQDIEVQLDGTPNPGDTPTFALQNITINDRELAVFATDRISVSVL